MSGLDDLQKAEPSSRQEASPRNECPSQIVCEDCILDDSGKACVKYQDGECWEQIWEDETDEWDSYEEGYDF